MSPWPLITGLTVLGRVVGLVNIFVFGKLDLFFFSLFILIIVAYSWWRDVVRERTYQGYHSGIVVGGLIIGIILFIVREIFFFLSFFWAFFHSRLNPAVELGVEWPPVGVFPLNPFQVPLLNTVILLARGVSITWCHQSILSEDWGVSKKSLMLTWLLGIYFLRLQGFEYYIAGFRISDSVYGAVFFIATGFHGFHVIVGTVFLIIITVRLTIGHFRRRHHFGFECAAWYWHFVDVVWLFLFSVVYWWGTY